jgi:hypothetical protein
LTHDATGEAVLAARAGELREAFGIDQRPVHGSVESRARASLLGHRAGDPNSLGSDA